MIVNAITPDRICLEESFAEDIVAQKADVRVTIGGSSLYTGDLALKKAEELRQLTEELRRAGVAEGDICLADFRAHAESGLLRKSSAVTYVLKIRCNDLDCLGDILTTVAMQRNAALDEIAWIYPQMQPRVDECLARCIQSTNERAGMIAQALGVEIIGVHALSEDLPSPEDRFLCAIFGAIDDKRSRGERLDAEKLGVSISHRKRVTIRIKVEYRISPLKAAS